MSIELKINGAKNKTGYFRLQTRLHFRSGIRFADDRVQHRKKSRSQSYDRRIYNHNTGVAVSWGVYETKVF
jgi:hypothetical protein